MLVLAKSPSTSDDCCQFPDEGTHLPDIIITITIWYDVSIYHKLFAFSLVSFSSNLAQVHISSFISPEFPLESHIQACLVYFGGRRYILIPIFPSFRPLLPFSFPPTLGRCLSQIAPSSVAIVSLA